MISGAGINEDKYLSAELMYFFLNRVPASRRILSAIHEKFITADDKTGRLIELTITGEPYPLPLLRVVDPWGNDPWGNVFDYRYKDGDNFPVIVSAGADGEFNTRDDITSR